MKIKYKNNADKLVYLGIPGVFLILGLLLSNIYLTAIGLLLTVSISSVLFQYISGYRKQRVVIEIEDNILKIRSNGKYDIPLKDINVLEVITNKNYKRPRLEITYILRDNS